MRFDRNGNQITTLIGKFAVGNMRKSVKSNNNTRKSLQANLNSDTGAADLGSPDKKEEKK